MSIPSNIVTELAELQAQVQAATPLGNASYATIKAMQLNAGNLVNDIATALAETSTLDTWSAPTDAPSIISGFDGIVTANDDQSNLALQGGIVGRVSLNLDQLV